MSSGACERACQVNLLAIGLDDTLVRDVVGSGSDAHQRQLKYATVLESYHLLVRTLGGSNLPVVQKASNFWVYPSNSSNKFTFVWDAIRIGGRICREHGIDVISTQDPFATALAGYVLKRRYRLPLSIQFAGDMVDNPYWLKERKLYPAMNVLARWLIKQGDTFRVVSIQEKDKLVAMGIPEDRVWNLGWITDFSRFVTADGSHIRHRYLGNRFSHLVLFAGRLVDQKDLPTLLKAIPLVLGQHNDVRFLLVGDGNRREKLRNLAQELQISEYVVFAGEVSYDHIPAHFAACDLFVLPSVYEGNARVLAEAAAAAKPVVATEVSGTRDTVVDGETGYIVPPREPATLARQIISLLNDPQRAKEMGEEGQTHVMALYEENRLLEGFRELWETTARCL
ncbi:MAG: glycosyltransferase family 4 protein [Anaerolineae bacterium]